MLPGRGAFALYGPFNYNGTCTSESNARFNAMLRGRDPVSGSRDVLEIIILGENAGLRLEADNGMPANNRLPVFRRSS